ncbi:hypothetical protein [Pseudomonas putida]|uniref:Uncharacterized protein n=1 Tax=Pseudomonas putida TaxID=303 RepID=A0A8I1JGV4_PSEPU|nr:hypothetical protein [Pseudomonas putida]MBI6883192.1 hypothetical protein [Pseudomonas putida]
MTKAELFAEMRGSKTPKDYLDISSIPEELRDHEVLTRWMDYCDVKCGGRGGRAFAQIPKPLVTDAMRRKAVTTHYDCLEHILPEDTEMYQELFRLALYGSEKAFSHLHDSMKTLSTLKVILSGGPMRCFDLFKDDQRWILPLLTPELIADVLRRSSDFALNLPEDAVPWSTWRYVFKGNPSSAMILAGQGMDRLSIYQRFLDEGEWPSSYEDEWPHNFDGKRSKTNDPCELLELVNGYLPKDPEHWVYLAKLKTIPIENVVSAIVDRYHVPMILKVYPEDTLRKYMKHSALVKHALIEADLGM